MTRGGAIRSGCASTAGTNFRDLSQLDERSRARTSLCLWRGNLYIAWVDNSDYAINLAQLVEE